VAYQLRLSDEEMCAISSALTVPFCERATADRLNLARGDAGCMVIYAGVPRGSRRQSITNRSLVPAFVVGRGRVSRSTDYNYPAQSRLAGEECRLSEGHHQAGGRVLQDLSDHGRHPMTEWANG
jgi:hypothetical protein